MPEELKLLEQHLKNRSRKFFQLAYLSRCVIAGIIILGISIYVYGGKFTISKCLELKKEKVTVIKSITDHKLEEIVSEMHQQNLSKEKYYEVLRKFRNDSNNMIRSVSEIDQKNLFIKILAICATISLIFFQAFLIHILDSIYKFNKDLGIYFKDRAESAKYAGTTIIEEEQTLAKFIAPNSFESQTPQIKPDPQTKNIPKK